MRSIAALLLATAACAASAQEYRLPFDGRWFVLQAGDTLNVNHHMALRAQWYGIDFARVGGPEGRELVRTNGATVDDFHCWGAEVLAPVAGTVIAVADDQPDNPPGRKDPTHPLGNHVVLKAAEDQYVFLAHFRREPAVVRVGERVERGRRVGRCGNSGHSDFPHVHMHVQDGPTFNVGQGRNIVFTAIDVELAGKPFTQVDWPLTGGLFVRNH